VVSEKEYYLLHSNKPWRLDSRLAVEVAKNVEKQTISFSEIVKQQLEEEMLKNV